MNGTKSQLCRVSVWWSKFILIRNYQNCFSRNMPASWYFVHDMTTIIFIGGARLELSDSLQFAVLKWTMNSRVALKCNIKQSACRTLISDVTFHLDTRLVDGPWVPQWNDFDNSNLVSPINLISYSCKMLSLIRWLVLCSFKDLAITGLLNLCFWIFLA